VCGCVHTHTHTLTHIYMYNSNFIAIKPAWRFQGDGVLSFNPLLRPIQLPWLNALSVRTTQKDAFLMSIQVGQNSSAVLSVSRVLLVYRSNILVDAFENLLCKNGSLDTLCFSYGIFCFGRRRITINVMEHVYFYVCL
jgi:hypothetical protein